MEAQPLVLEVPTHRVTGKSRVKALLYPQHPVTAGPIPAERSVERLAADMHARQLFQRQRLALLVAAMPTGMFKSQRSAETFGGDSFFTGGWVRGNLVGLSNHARDFPNVTTYLVAFLKQRTSLPFASIGLVVGRHTAVHKDVRNRIGTSNILLPVRLSQGSLWVEDADGTEDRVVRPNHSRRGKTVPLHQDVVLAFDPKLYHQACLSNGSLVLVGYTPCSPQFVVTGSRGYGFLGFSLYAPPSTEFWSVDEARRMLVRHHPVPRTTWFILPNKNLYLFL